MPLAITTTRSIKVSTTDLLCWTSNFVQVIAVLFVHSGPVTRALISGLVWLLIDREGRVQGVCASDECCRSRVSCCAHGTIRNRTTRICSCCSRGSGDGADANAARPCRCANEQFITCGRVQQDVVVLNARGLWKMQAGRCCSPPSPSYSQDLRDRVLGALGRGEGPASIARRLEVSRVWVCNVRDRERKTGQRASLPIGGHRRSRVAEVKPELCAWIEQEPDLSLAELCQRLAKQGVSIKIGALWHQLNKWNLTFKKNPARRRARARGRATSSARVDGGAAEDGRRKASVHRGQCRQTVR